METLMTLKEVAQAAGLTYAGVYAWVMRGKLKTKRIGNMLLVRRKEVQKFLASRPQSTSQLG